MHRKILPLALMYAEDGEIIEGRTRLQKMVFLLEKELEELEKSPIDSSDYDFIPYDYGPFSKKLYDDLDYLSKKGLIDDIEEEMDDGQVKYNYKITSKGEEFVESQLNSSDSELIRKLAEQMKRNYNSRPISSLIDYVYSEYPEYAENSVW
jgi:uncharacterized protein YwgA